MEGLVTEIMIDLLCFKGKRILLTGHTGFKGSWLSQILLEAGAEVSGYAMKPLGKPTLFDILQLDKSMPSYIGDIADLESLQKVFDEVKPEIVIHLAAQPIVRESYQNPVWTYQTNVMGTVNILECVRKSDFVHSFLNVTTDKVYKNREWEWGYRENEELCGYDPYSNSKSCSELVTYSYANSFFKDSGIAISTARAGNVIGGGDFAVDRIVPDCYRAAGRRESILVRNPNSIRPYQHVLEPLMAYLTIVSKQNEDKAFAGHYNIGPDEEDCITTGRLVNLFCDKWQKYSGNELNWENGYVKGPHEANFLKLDCARFKKTFDWKPVWHIEQAIDKTAEWYCAYEQQLDIKKLMAVQLNEYLKDGQVNG